MRNKLMLLVVLTLIITIYQFFSPLPWWSFTVVLFLCGIIVSHKIWVTRPFVIGFFSGLLSWLIAHFYFTLSFEGDIVTRIAELFEIYVVFLIALIGLIGGLLGGLSFYAGVELRRRKKVMNLEIENE